MTKISKEIPSPQLRENAVSGSMDCEKWLSNYETKLKELGYKKYFNQNFKNETFSYWKSFGDKDYQIGVLFYDFREFQAKFHSSLKISVQFECMINCDDRVDLTVSKDISLETFELMAKIFFSTMMEYCH